MPVLSQRFKVSNSGGSFGDIGVVGGAAGPLNSSGKLPLSQLQAHASTHALDGGDPLTDYAPAAIIDCADWQRLEGAVGQTAFQPGQLVRIPDHANRIERYLGGTASDNSNWLVLKNTVQLIVSNATSENTLIVNGMPVSKNAGAVYTGWADMTKFSTSGNNTYYIKAYLVDMFVSGYLGDYLGGFIFPAPNAVRGNNFGSLPYKFADRSTVSLTLQNYA